MKYLFTIGLMLLAIGSTARADEAAMTQARAVDGIASNDPATVARSIAFLRSAGPEGLSAALERYSDPTDKTVSPRIDAIAGQYGAIRSRLYWYTDLHKAEAAASAQNKNILYLRLLGKLTDEYSCANSRFFKTVLYTNAAVSKLLREQYILVWESERPVPVVTIDFGDGRVLKRTLTGNSIHYVLDSQGNVIDALPGLYSPARFINILSHVGWDGSGNYSRYVSREENNLLERWQADVTRLGKPVVVKLELKSERSKEGAPAARAMDQTRSKALVELPLLREALPQLAVALDQSISQAQTDLWRQVAALHQDEAKLDAASIDLIRSQNPSVYDDPSALKKTVVEFETNIAIDSVRNDYLLRRQILGWLREAKNGVKLDDLNHRVYSELFLTPRSDPWLGLMPQDVYTALTDNGRCGDADNVATN